MAFNFQAYRNPYVSTIAELLSRGEDAKAKALVDVANAQARAAEIRGQAYGGAVADVGKIVAGLPAQIQAGKDQAFKTAQQARMVKTQQQDDAAEALANKMMSQRNVAGSVMGPLSDTMVSPAVSPSLASRSLIPQVPGAAGPSGWQEHPEVLGAPEVRTLPSRQSTMTVTNPSKRLAVGDVLGLDLWDTQALGQQFAAQGLGVQGQKYLELMRDSNADMEKHHASALAVARNDAARILKLADSQIALAVDQLVEKYSNNGVFPTKQLEMVKQQIVAIKQLPQNQQLLAYKKLAQSVGDVESKFVQSAPGDQLLNTTTGQNLGGAPAKPIPVTLIGAPYEKLDENGKPGLYQRRSDGTESFVGKPVPPAATGSESSEWKPGRDDNNKLLMYRTVNGKIETMPPPQGLAATGTPQTTYNVSAQGKSVLRATDVAEPMMAGLIADMEKALPGINDPKLNAKYNSLSSKAGALTDWAKYSLGFEASNTPQIQIAKLLQAVQAGQYMTSSRNIRMLDLVLSHLSDPKQTPLRQYEALKTLEGIMPEIRAAVVKAEQPMNLNAPVAETPVDTDAARNAEVAAIIARARSGK